MKKGNLCVKELDFINSYMSFVFWVRFLKASGYRLAEVRYERNSGFFITRQVVCQYMRRQAGGK